MLPFRSHSITFEAAIRDLAESRRVDSRAEAAAALGDLPDDVDHGQAARALLAALADPEAEVRAAAAWSLGEHTSEPDVLGALTARLADASPAVGAAAAVSLGRCGAPAFAALERALVEAPPEVRYQAAYSLAGIDGERAYFSLVKALGDRDPEVRAGVARALAHAGDRRAVDWLLPLLEDPADNARFEAALAMVRLGDARAVTALLPFLAQGRAWEILDVLEELGDASAAQAIAPLIERGPQLLRVRAAAALLALAPSHPAAPVAQKVIARGTRAWRSDVRGLARDFHARSESV